MKGRNLPFPLLGGHSLKILRFVSSKCLSRLSLAVIYANYLFDLHVAVLVNIKTTTLVNIMKARNNIYRKRNF